jgi:thiamine-phosphate diphosphorylase
MKILCVTNQALCKGDYLQQLQKIAAAKPDAMILREKQLSETAYQALAEQVQRICQGQGVQLICNHQISVAERLSLPVQVSVSQLEQASAWSVPFGVSVHKLEEAKQAEQAGASWVIAGHVFATACKPDLPPRGLSFLQEIKQAVSIPVASFHQLKCE